VAVKYSTKVDEPVGEILENLNKDIIERLAKTLPVSEVEYLGSISDVTVTNVSVDTQVKGTHSPTGDLTEI
jgi:enoyl reductase-like protein